MTSHLQSHIFLVFEGLLVLTTSTYLHGFK